MGDKPSERTYVPWERAKALQEYLYPDTSRILIVHGIGLVLLVLTAIVVPFNEPFRSRLGWYFYLHIALVIVFLAWFFFKFLRPASCANERMHRGFMKKLHNKKLQELGVDPMVVAASAIAPDGDTLEITVSDHWLGKPYEDRLQDACCLWQLWACVYQPYDGCDKVLIRLLDAAGKEVGGSRPKEGSQIYIREA